MAHSITSRQELAPAPVQVDGNTARGRSRAASTLAVVLLLVALAAWGHTSGWKLPDVSSFSGLLGARPEPVEDWCQAHNVPESVCIECNPKLLADSEHFGWCKEHGVNDCPLEHPEVVQLKAAPEVTAADLERARAALALLPRSENNSHCTLLSRHVQFASADALAKAGVDIALVTRRAIVETVTANGEVVYDETRQAHLASPVAGTVWRVEKQLGDRVERGEVLALVDAAEIGRAKAELLQALAALRLKRINAQRLEPLAADGSIPGKVYREAQAALDEAEIRFLGAQQTLINWGLPSGVESNDDAPVEQIAERLRFLGLPAAMVAQWEGRPMTSNLFPLRAPLGGVVIDRDIVSGEVVDAGQLLLAVADVSQMWLVLDVRQNDARLLELGQSVHFEPGDAAGETVRGSLAWISTAVDDRTRTVKVRVDLPNDSGRLRANTFGTGEIVLRDEPQAIVAPTEAVHWDGDCHVVFVRDKNFFDEGAPKFFHVRQVRVGVRNGDTTEIIAGVWPGEVIASTNSAVLQAQLQKANLGAGCCEPTSHSH